ncbi:rhodanese-like/PpiC domain-containing protein 12, chloroplastic [Solanum lycopersicum]|uniref:Peptidylprolyl isomerase n=1 Tax=Solanum lycopersicum TaxID=4081 RepID=A0A3Q7JFQ5_SOLLC|nr:rhodanese-like/PpiC domain-containing protein 12, chloroplastic [Solanum lycopersicum]XP_010314700.1 rhodanese-like/PpiC domain-containing protein 12, chloroplastic [Solanum lycopersicum]
MLRISSSSSSLHVPSICGAPVSFILSFLNPSSRKVSNFTRLALLHSTTLFPNSRNFQFPTFRRVSTMMGRTHSCSRVVTASYSAASGPGGSSGGDREILVQHLLVKEDDQKLLLDLQKKTAEGEDLSDLAVEYSMCPSKEDGGMLGWVRKGQMVPEFEEAAFGAPLNKVVKCKTKFGWHLLQVLSEREESVLEHIQPNEFHVRLQDPSFLEEAQLIDVREPEEVAQASVPGFQILPLRQFGVWGPEITTKFDPQKDTYVLCHHGVRSLQVAKWLQTQGFRKVFNVAGGIHEYAVKVDPSIPTY